MKSHDLCIVTTKQTHVVDEIACSSVGFLFVLMKTSTVFMAISYEFTLIHLASFPGLLRLQFLIVCMIKNWRRGGPGNEARYTL